MPLNIQKNTPIVPEEESKSTHFSKPKRYISFIKYFFVGLSIIAVVSSIIFLIYIFTLRQPKTIQKENEILQLPTIDTSVATIPAPPETATKDETPVIKPESTTPIPHVYCVYIAAYKNEQPAAEEVSRWKEAGFVATVVESNNHFCVALGRYATISEARLFAEQMWEAFEYGYFIGRVRIIS